MANQYVPNGFPHLLITGNTADEGRLKTASMPAINSAAINSKLYSFSSPFSVSAGHSEIYNISVAGLSLFYSVEASGMDIVIYNQAATGTFGAIDAAHNMNFATGNGFHAYAQEMTSFTANGDASIACFDSCNPSIVADESSPFAVKITNNSTATISGYLSMLVESIGEYLPTFGLQGNTELLSGTEMSVYG